MLDVFTIARERTRGLDTRRCDGSIVFSRAFKRFDVPAGDAAGDAIEQRLFGGISIDDDVAVLLCGLRVCWVQLGIVEFGIRNVTSVWQARTASVVDV